jgi:hypothetical protein
MPVFIYLGLFAEPGDGNPEFFDRKGKDLRDGVPAGLFSVQYRV